MAKATRTRVNKHRRRADTNSMTVGAHLMTLSNLMRRITSRRFQHLFNLTLVDGWVVSHLGNGGPMSLDELSYRTGLVKSQMSRSVTQMVVRKLVLRNRNPENQNEVILTLTRDGLRIFANIKARWPDYYRLLMSGLSSRECAAFADMVMRLIDNSRRNLEREYGGTSI